MVSLASVVSDIIIFFHLGFSVESLVVGERYRNLNDTQQMDYYINSDFIFSQNVFVKLLGFSKINIDPFFEDKIFILSRSRSMFTLRMGLKTGLVALV